jgi:hypothetical protein
MKFLKTLLVLLIVIFVVTSCRRIENPESVVVKFVNHIAQKEFEEAKQYGTQSTIEIVEMTALLESIGFYVEDESMPLISEDDVSCNVTGSTAICSFMEYGEMVQISLVLENRRWLVDMQMDYEFPDDFEYEELEFEEEDTIQEPVI